MTSDELPEDIEEKKKQASNIDPFEVQRIGLEELYKWTGQYLFPSFPDAGGVSENWENIENSSDKARSSVEAASTNWEKAATFFDTSSKNINDILEPARKRMQIFWLKVKQSFDSIINTAWFFFEEFWSSVLTVLGDTILPAWNSFVNAFVDIKDEILETLEGPVAFIKTLFENIKTRISTIFEDPVTSTLIIRGYTE